MTDDNYSFKCVDEIPNGYANQYIAKKNRVESRKITKIEGLPKFKKKE